MPHPHTDTRRPRKAAISAPDHRDAPTWTQCGPDCVRPTPNQAHCPVAGCHRTFGGVSNFDKHRRNGWCLDPATLGMTLNGAGIWRIPMPDDVRERKEWARG